MAGRVRFFFRGGGGGRGRRSRGGCLRAGEPLVCVADLNASVLVLVYAAAFTRERKRLGPRLHEVHDPIVVDSQFPRELAILLPREDQIEVLVVTQGKGRGMRTQRFASESLVIVGTEF